MKIHATSGDVHTTNQCGLTLAEQSLISMRPVPLFRMCHALGNAVSKSPHVSVQLKGYPRLSTVLAESTINHIK